MKQGMTKNPGGIGNKREQVAQMGGFISITGGGQLQRQHAREYGKALHIANDKEAREQDADDAQIPFLDISVPKQVR